MTVVSSGVTGKAVDNDEVPRGVARVAQGKPWALRYDRWAGLLAWFGAGYMVFIAIRAVLGRGEAVLLPLEGGLPHLIETLEMSGVVALLIFFALADALLGRALRMDAPWARRAALVRGVSSLLLAVVYYTATSDFGGAFGLGFYGGGMLALLARNAGLLMAFPSVIWLGVFFVLPLIGVFVSSLGSTTALGIINTETLSLANYERILTPVGRSGLLYVNIILRTVWIAFLTTLICLMVSYPFAFWMARQPEKWRNLLLMLVMIPFWTNLLIRTFAWVIILRKDGLLNGLLVDVLGVISRPLELLNTPGALLLGLVYGYLPFMILPLYNSIERLDRRYVEAATDLYAEPVRAFWRVVFPLTLPGIIAGSILVFIPAVGTYVVSNVLGGGKFFLIGNLLEQQFIGASGDKAFGAAFGVVLTVLMLGATMIYFRLGRKASLT